MVLFEKKVHDYIEEQQLIEEGDRLLIACSGGLDSMGLLHFFIHYKRKCKIQLYVAHVDHMLRGDTSLEDRRFVEQFCNEHDIPIFSTSIPIPKILEEEGGNSQAICRRERYNYFANIMSQKNIHKLVTAHHADDQLESMLMSLVKSGNMTGLKGIAAKREFIVGTIIRPFLTVTKMEIWQYLLSREGTYREDASNLEDDYTRNRFRHHIVPLLKKENKQVALHAVQLAESLQQDDEYLNILAKDRFSYVVEKDNEQFILNIKQYQKEPVALQRRIILILLNYLYEDSNYNQSYTLCKIIMKLCKSQEGNATIHLPKNFVAIRSYNQVVFSQGETSPKVGLSQQLTLGKWHDLQGFRLYIGELSDNISIQENSVKTYYFNANSFSTPFKVRYRIEGDRISLKGMTEAKRISRLFIDEKIPLIKRDQWPILVDAKDEIIAVIGIRVNKELSSFKRKDDNMVMIVKNTSKN